MSATNTISSLAALEPFLVYILRHSIKNSRSCLVRLYFELYVVFVDLRRFILNVYRDVAPKIIFAQICRLGSRGYGFICYSDELSKRKCLDVLNHTIRERRIKLRPCSEHVSLLNLE